MWNPTPWMHSYLWIIDLYLQCHFEECQFEMHRADGVKKLRWNAIPTIFHVPNPPKPLTLKRPANRLVVEKSKAAEAASRQPLIEHDYSTKKRRPVNKENIPVVTPPSTDHTYGKGTLKHASFTVPLAADLPDDHADSRDLPNSQSTSVSTGSISAIRSRMQAETINRMRNQIRSLRRRLAAERRRSSNLTINLQKFLNEDQLECLKLRSRHSRRWSNRTVKKALQIRCAAGAQGYSHLVKEGFPLPSYRTLCEKVESAQFRPGLQVDIIEWLREEVSRQPPMSRDCVLHKFFA